MAHYKGELVHKEGITFRFWGAGDDLMVVRVNGKLVLNASRDDALASSYASRISPFWQTPEKAKHKKYWLGSVTSVVGDWITLEPGVPLDMEVLIGETLGDFFCAMLLVEVQGVEYERVGRLLAPALPMFTTTDLTRDVIEAVRSNLVPGEAGVTNGPVFRDFDLGSTVVRDAGVAAPVVPEVVPMEDVPEDKTRTWTGTDGKMLEAEFVATIGDKAVLKDSRGRQRKIPLAQLSGEDRLFIELANSPKFNIDFSKQSSQTIVEKGPFAYPGAEWTPRFYDYVFSTRLKQSSAGEYNHELHIEFFAIGEEIDGNNYILLDRQESDFTPTKENGRSHSFSGDKLRLEVRDWSQVSMYRGQKYGGYLVVVTDSRGEVIDVGSSHNWLPDLTDKLRELPLGKHFDKTGTRVYPPSPNIWY